jgi:hypothetical protein
MQKYKKIWIKSKNAGENRFDNDYPGVITLLQIKKNGVASQHLTLRISIPKDKCQMLTGCPRSQTHPKKR